MTRTWLVVAGLTLGLGLCACGPVDPTTCSGDSDCLEEGGGKYVCDTADTQQCLRRCTVQSECLQSQHCAPLVGTSHGVCRFGRVTTP